MASVTAQDFINLMNITDSTTNMEHVINMAIHTLNLYGAAPMTSMAGEAGSKTVTLTSKQEGGVFHLTRIIYYEFFQTRETVGLGAMSVSSIELLANPTIMSAVEKIAKRLKTVDFAVGEDTSGIE